jgi:hypothetical protein
MKTKNNADFVMRIIYWVELILKEAFPQRFKEWDRLCSGSAVQTLKNFKNAGYDISAAPVAGAIVIWQEYRGGVVSWQGHAGICAHAVNSATFRTYEANTSAQNARKETSLQQRPGQQPRN